MSRSLHGSTTGHLPRYVSSREGSLVPPTWCIVCHALMRWAGFLYLSSTRGTISFPRRTTIACLSLRRCVWVSLTTQVRGAVENTFHRLGREAWYSVRTTERYSQGVGAPIW